MSILDQTTCARYTVTETRLSPIIDRYDYEIDGLYIEGHPPYTELATEVDTVLSTILNPDIDIDGEPQPLEYTLEDLGVTHLPHTPARIMLHGLALEYERERYEMSPDVLARYLSLTTLREHERTEVSGYSQGERLYGVYDTTLITPAHAESVLELLLGLLTVYEVSDALEGVNYYIDVPDEIAWIDEDLRAHLSHTLDAVPAEIKIKRIDREHTAYHYREV